MLNKIASMFLIPHCNKVQVQINHIIYKTKESCKHLIYSSLILIYCIFSDLYFTSSNIKYIDNQLVTVIKIQMICKCKYKTI